MTDYDELLDKGMDEAEENQSQGERFEVPDVDTRKQGSKTVITNFSDIVDTFGRDEKEFSKYVQNEVGTAGHIEGKELVLNGEFRRGTIQGKIQQYADEYVFCPECGSPDTKLVKEKGVEMMKCQACGARSPL